MTMAAGLAMAGLHPVVSVYATFLNRAFDQLLMDVALHRLPVTVTLDRAGVTGPDGASHNGMWDGSILQVVPGPAGSPRRATAAGSPSCSTRPSASATAPRSSATRRATVGAEAEAVGKLGQMDVLAVPGRRTGPGRAAARRRPDGGHLRRGRAAGWPATASASPSSTRAGSSRSTRPSSRRRGSTGWSRSSRTTAGSAGSATRWRGCCATTTWTSRSRRSASRRSSSTHGTREEILEAAGLSPQHLARQLTEAVARRTPEATAARPGAGQGPRGGRAGDRLIDARAAPRVALPVCSRLPGSPSPVPRG